MLFHIINSKNKDNMLSIYLIFLFLFFGIIFWLIDSFLDYVYFYAGYGNFIELLVRKVPPHEVYIRIIFLLTSFIFGIIFSIIFKYKIQSEQQYRALFDKMINGFAYHKVILNEKKEPVDYFFLELNKSFEEMTGLKKSDTIGKKVTELIPEIKSAKPDLINIYGKVALTGKDVKFELFFEPFNKWYSVIAFSPSYEHFAVVIDDITKRKQAEIEIKELNENLEERVKKRTEQLASSNRELEAFSYSVSHDLKAPLRAVEGFANILKEEYAGKLDEEADRLIDVIVENTVNMGQLISDLLSFSRMSRKEMQFEKIEVKELIDDVINAQMILKKERKIDFKINEIIPIHGDASMIKQVLTNLISNAVKFTSTRDHTEIEIGSKRENNEIVYYIKDNGVGFDMAYKDKVFGVFQRLHGLNEFEGTGIGLALVQRIIHKHDGRVWVNAYVGEGATFYFSLPINPNI